MGDIEQSGLLAGMQVFGNDPLVLHGHVVTGERHHARTQFPMQGIKRGGF